MCGGGGSAKRAANAADERARAQAAEAEKLRLQDVAREEARQAQIRQGVSSVNTAFDNTFNDNFFNDIASKYTAAYAPQLGDQFAEAKKNLAYDLSAKGLTNSSVAADRYGKLQDKYNTTQQEIQSRGTDAANTSRANASNTRTNLINQVNSGSDLNTINNLVSSNLQTLQAPQTYTSLGDIFGQLALVAAGAGVSGQGQNPFGRTTGAGPNVAGATNNVGTKVYN